MKHAAAKQLLAQKYTRLYEEVCRKQIILENFDSKNKVVEPKWDNKFWLHARLLLFSTYCIIPDIKQFIQFADWKYNQLQVYCFKKKWP